MAIRRFTHHRITFGKLVMLVILAILLLILILSFQNVLFSMTVNLVLLIVLLLVRLLEGQEFPLKMRVVLGRPRVVIPVKLTLRLLSRVIFLVTLLSFVPTLILFYLLIPFNLNVLKLPVGQPRVTVLILVLLPFRVMMVSFLILMKLLIFIILTMRKLVLLLMSMVISLLLLVSIMSLVVVGILMLNFLMLLVFGRVTVIQFVRRKKFHVLSSIGTIKLLVLGRPKRLMLLNVSRLVMFYFKSFLGNLTMSPTSVFLFVRSVNSQ